LALDNVISAAQDTSTNTLGDKSAFAYRLALDNVTDEIVRNNDIPIVVEPVLQLQHEIIPHPIANQSIDSENAGLDMKALNKASDAHVRNNETPLVVALVLQLQQDTVSWSIVLNEDEGTDSERNGVEIQANCNPVLKSHPFATVIPHRCPIITKDLEIIQKALVVSNVVDVDGFTNVLSKSRKKTKGYQTRFRGPLPNPSQWRSQREYAEKSRRSSGGWSSSIWKERNQRLV
jgi:hypothetical protein